MKRVGGWLTPRSGSPASKSLTALDEPVALQEALKAAVKIMNDEVEEAEIELSKGTSPFHKLGSATTIFLRATLGFEKEIMEQASLRLADAEESAAEHHRRALRDPSTAHHSEIYPVGSEYALCHAESQLMSAVLGVLNESLIESLRGFQKLRRAFAMLHEIVEAEKNYIEGHRGKYTKVRSGTPSSGVDSAKAVAASDDSPSDSSGILTPAGSDDLPFEDAVEQVQDTAMTDSYRGHFEHPDMDTLKLTDTITQSTPVDDGPHTLSSEGRDNLPTSPPPDADEEVDMRTYTDDPIDLFIHSGTSLCFGVLQLCLSMVPPAFSKILSFFSFRGDRATGLRMLWSATTYKENINGALAGWITLSFHSGAIAFCDILTADAYPEARLKHLLKDMRTLYPKSKLWVLEEGRMLGVDRQLQKSLDVLQRGGRSPLKQIEAFCVFERSLDYLFLHRYEDCAASFIECMKLNNWSHGLYYYIAGVCNVELYRIHKISDPKLALKHADRAAEYLEKVPEASGKKRFMSRQLPIDSFVQRKVAKWEHRSKTKGCPMIDAIGVSPVAEMTYFWSGYRRMTEPQFQRTLERLAWSEEQAGWRTEAADEKALLSVIRGVALRSLGRTADARAELTNTIDTIPLSRIKACDLPETWPLPVAHYELAVCYWQEAGGQGGNDDLLQKCHEELSKAEKWESYDLDARVGMKITTARDSLRRCGIPSGS